jgi:hypothetical protein
MATPSFPIHPTWGETVQFLLYVFCIALSGLCARISALGGGMKIIPGCESGVGTYYLSVGATIPLLS